MTTPARALDLPVDDGCRILQAEEGTWLDGGEARVREILASASDLSSLSDELAHHDESWEVRYHLSPERANIVRPLALGPGSVVLEVGAGCGAVTRHLGEVAGAVDALEPTTARAKVARLRTRDLDNVEVFAGWLEELPREPAYDAIILIGVLEYVGGREGTAERVTMLREAVARLRPDGGVVCAIENRLGVQYLTGAPEEHVGLAFEGVDGYPRLGPARTFSRAELEQLFVEAGLRPRMHHVFPDYKFARLLFADSLLHTHASPLAWRAPSFPSTASPHPRPWLGSEERLWRALVETGQGGQFANSFLVVATAGERPGPWPAGLHAAFYAANRRAAYACETRVRSDEDTVQLERRRLAPEAPAPSGGLAHRVEGSRWLEGVPLLELAEDAGEAELASLMRRWREHVEAHAEGSQGANVDLGPHHVLVGPDGLVTLDEEWFDVSYSAADVVDRGLLHAALMLADRRAPERWPEGSERVVDALHALAEAAGVPGLAERLDAVVRREAELLADVQTAPAGTPRWRAAAGRREADLRAALARPLSETLLAPHRGGAASRREVEWLHTEVAARDRRVVELQARVDELESAHATVARSKSWRLTSLPRRAAASLRSRRA